VLGARGYARAEGLDPDPAAVALARSHGLTINAGLASESPTRYAGRQFDLIVLSHVAEHLRDLDWLPRLATLLAPGGRLYIEVPDPRGYRCDPRPPYYYFDSEHINHFSPLALAQAFRHGRARPQGLSRLHPEPV
jgi:SAM-dependent methyltransferase